jgi:hypothetical protein
MKKLVYARDGKEFSRAVIVERRTVFELNRDDPDPPPVPQKNTNIHGHNRRRQ